MSEIVEMGDKIDYLHGLNDRLADEIARLRTLLAEVTSASDTAVAQPPTRRPHDTPTNRRLPLPVRQRSDQ